MDQILSNKFPCLQGIKLIKNTNVEMAFDLRNEGLANL